MKLICVAPGSGELLEAITRTIIGTRTGSMIDVCCGEAHIIKKLDQFQKRIAIDAVNRFPKGVKCVEFHLADVLEDHHIFDGKYDVALCYDAIEHFNKSNGSYLLSLLQRISDVNILFTPIQGFDCDINYLSQEAC